MSASMRHTLWTATALIVAVAALYTAFLWNPVVFDDLYLFNGVTVHAYGNSSFSLHSRWLPYASLGWTANWLGLDLIGFRLGNMALHGANVVLLFLLMRRLFDVISSDNPTTESTFSSHWLAFFGALLFALHPVTVYATGYLIQRTILMATLFSLLSWYSYLEGLVRTQQRWFFFSVICYLLAILCKEHAVMVPMVTMAMTILLRPPSLALFRHIAWSFVAFSIIAVWAVIQSQAVLGVSYELNADDMLKQLSSSHGQAIIEHAYPLSVITQCSLFFKYLLLWIIPNPAWMSIDMREPFATSLLAWPYTIGALGFILYGVGAAWLLLQRGPKGLLGFAMLFPWLLFATELSSVRIQEPFVLYRSYLWMPGIYAALPFLLGAIPMQRALALLLAASVLMFPLAWNRLTTFSHPLLLWDDAASLLQDGKKIAGADRIYNNRGLAFYRAKMRQEALHDFNRALELKPNDGHVYHNRGVIHLDTGRYQEALRDFGKASELVPNYPRSYMGQGLVFEAMHMPQKAQENFQKACLLGMPEACSHIQKTHDK